MTQGFVLALLHLCASGSLRENFHKQQGNNMKNINLITADIVDLCFKIHSKLGPGLFESVYEKILIHELERKGYEIENQKHIPVIWEGTEMDFGFRADIIVENRVIIEIKSVEKLNEVHFKQILTYLKVLNIKLGLLINFNESLIKYGIRRVINNKFEL